MTNDKHTVLVLLSGGLDSTTVLAEALHEGHPVTALSINYGQLNMPELRCARDLATIWRFPIAIEHMTLLHQDPMKEIPGRNTLFLAKALEYALTHKIREIRYGAEPDARYVDSSLPYIESMRTVFALHGVDLQAPVKLLGGKLDVLKRALDLGVPLDLLHSSLTAEMNGKDTTSGRFFGALHSLFPYVEPRVLLDQVRASRCIHKPPQNVWSPITESFKHLPALFLLAATPPSKVPLTVYTTGNWGKSLVAMNEMTRTFPEIKVIQTTKVEELFRNTLNTNAPQAQWGMKQALGWLPRPQYLPAHVGCPVTQGHLRHCLRSLGYLVAEPREQAEYQLITQRPAPCN